ncbi:hypothetical protein D9M68_830950 [compost metagenome]
MTRHQANALVRQLQLGVDGREALDGRRAADDDLGAAEGLQALLRQLDAVALPPQVQVAVVRLLHRHAWHRSGFHAGRAVGAHQFEEAPGKLLEVLPLLQLAAAQVDLLLQPRRGLDHRLQLFGHVLLGRLGLGEQHQDR